MTLPQTVDVSNDNTTQQSVSSKPVEESYAVTDVVTVVARDKKGKKVCIRKQCVHKYVYICVYTVEPRLSESPLSKPSVIQTYRNPKG